MAFRALLAAVALTAAALAAAAPASATHCESKPAIDEAVCWLVEHHVYGAVKIAACVVYDEPIANARACYDRYCVSMMNDQAWACL